MFQAPRIGTRIIPFPPCDSSPPFGADGVVKMLSDRGRLSGTAIDLVQTFAKRLGENFLPLIPVYLDPLIKLSGRPNKVILKRTEQCLATIISSCHLPQILFELKRGLADEATTCRRGSAIAFERALTEWSGKSVWTEKTLKCLEEALKKMAKDKDVEVRATSKRIWARFQLTFPKRIEG